MIVVFRNILVRLIMKIVGIVVIVLLQHNVQII